MNHNISQRSLLCTTNSPTVTFLVAQRETQRATIHNYSHQSTRTHWHPLWIEGLCLHETSRQKGLSSVRMQKIWERRVTYHHQVPNHWGLTEYLKHVDSKDRGECERQKEQSGKKKVGSGDDGIRLTKRRGRRVPRGFPLISPSSNYLGLLQPSFPSLVFSLVLFISPNI